MGVVYLSMNKFAMVTEGLLENFGGSDLSRSCTLAEKGNAAAHCLAGYMCPLTGNRIKASPANIFRGVGTACNKTLQVLLWSGGRNRVRLQPLYLLSKLLLVLVLTATTGFATEPTLAIGIRSPYVVTVVNFPPPKPSKNSLVQTLEKGIQESRQRTDSMDQEYMNNCKLSEMRKQTELLKKIANK
jgi:hypothetical protein